MLTDERRRPLGDLDPAESRHNWARSAATVADGTVVAGGVGGRLTAERPDATPAERWSTTAADPSAIVDSYVVSLAARDGTLVAGERGPDGHVAALSAATGDRRWRYATAADVGTATTESLTFQPYVVDVAVGGRTVAAARRYDRDGESRDWSSVVLGFDPDGDVRWRYPARAAPLALDARHSRVAVAYNRCTDAHAHGLVVLDADTGAPVMNWDPGTEGDRRVGDVAFLGDGVAVASHGDKHGYLLDADGGERWRVDLASERRVGGETVYAYPTHVRAAGDAAVFVTGNTYAESTRDPDARHPREHTIAAVDDGDLTWTHPVGGFARDVAADGSLVAVPSAQHFRERRADTHAVHLFDADRGHLDSRSIPGIAAAVALDGDTLAVVEEPVEYHDEGVTHGAFRLHTWRVDADER
ncbi:PQQ-binding-like beta-propeller repeat protein [Haloplanus pelagicus]|jgi:outer membrane protein assembly factor BamB|uniref:outer membrane protein assembly factor BamB family protein n=1 Tax=Haloplanus pelagicus TaxID=2949995 RepID=UPI002041FC62|nr:PQQ-binding-like beta-propeller repeat protein [Haloplanus sp. HW8-1]